LLRNRRKSQDAKGEPYVESYGSKESNGEPVRLAAMRPTTRTWQERQQAIVRRLFGECGVKAVYIDQVAAAKPELCFDTTHGHPLGGGSWWNEQGYWPLLDAIRATRPPDRVLTTECNADPQPVEPAIRESVAFPPRSVWAWEVVGRE
jgi:hypothetical protein